MPPAGLRFLIGWLIGKMLEIHTNLPKPALFCKVLLFGRLASPTEAGAKRSPLKFVFIGHELPGCFVKIFQFPA